MLLMKFKRDCVADCSSDFAMALRPVSLSAVDSSDGFGGNVSRTPCDNPRRMSIQLIAQQCLLNCTPHSRDRAHAFVRARVILSRSS
jgi:hypothetical protein